MELPKPKYTVTADEKHRYQTKMPDGSVIGPLKSVTKCIGILDKPALVGWSAREAANYFKSEILRLGGAITPEALDQIAKDAAMAHRRKSKDASDLGTKCHDIFEAIIQGREPEDIPAELAEATKDFKRWRMQSDIELVALELPIASVIHGFGGRLDAVGYSRARGGLGIVDYKTSKSLLYGNEYSYQVGGYAIAMEEQYGVKIEWAEIVRFGKVAPFDSEARPVKDLDAGMAGFLLTVALSKSADTQLIGEPSFCTKEIRDKEMPAPAKKKRVTSAMGF